MPQNLKVNLVALNNRTALMWAVEQGSSTLQRGVKVVEALLAAKADIDSRGAEHQMTSLALAIDCGHWKLGEVRLL